MLQRIKSLFKKPKRTYCQLCGEKLIIWYKTGNWGWEHEDWMMLSCPTIENSSITFASDYNEHYSTILRTNPKQPKYDIYTGRHLDGSTDSFRR